MRILSPMIMAVLVAGCGRSQEHHQPPEVLAERKNGKGEVIARFIVERNYATRDVLFTPEGPKTRVTHKPKFFIQEGDRPRRELSIFHNEKMLFGDELCYCGSYAAVNGTSRWVAAGVNGVSNENAGHPAVINGRHLISHNENDLHIVVFDDTHIISHRTFSVVPKWESSNDEFSFENGNHRVAFSSPQGPKEYDVLADVVLGEQNGGAK